MSIATVWEAPKTRIEYAELSETYGKFVVEPLERGFGVTLGHALRRTLLSAIPGAAVTSVKIEGVLHEFSTIPGVVEDVTQVILNVKELTLRLHTDKPKLLRLEARGKKAVTAADIIEDAEVDVLNPEMPLATLDKKDAKLAMELVVERGKGYVPAERHRKSEHVIGVIPVDSIFSPIQKVNYVVEDTRGGQNAEMDRLRPGGGGGRARPGGRGGRVAPAGGSRAGGRAHPHRFVQALRRHGRGVGGVGRARARRRCRDGQAQRHAHRGAGPLRAALQLPQARRHQHRRRPDAAHGRGDRHWEELRAEDAQGG